MQTDYTTYLEKRYARWRRTTGNGCPRLKGQDLIYGFIARNDAESLWVKKQMLAAEPAAVEPIPATQEELIAQEPEQPEEDETDAPDEEIDSTTDPETEQIEVETLWGRGRRRRRILQRRRGTKNPNHLLRLQKEEIDAALQ